MLLLAAALLLAIPASAAADGDCTRSYNIVLELTPAGVTERAVQIVYSSSPHPKDAPGTLTANVASGDGKVLQEFTVWDPRIQFGDDIVIDERGNVTRTAGISRRESRATLAVMFPASPQAAVFSLYDEKGGLLRSVDLRTAENRATWNCTKDYGIPRRETGAATLPANLFFFAGAALVIAGAAALGGWYFFLRKRS